MSEEAIAALIERPTEKRSLRKYPKSVASLLAMAVLACDTVVPTLFPNLTWEVGWLQLAFLASGVFVAQLTVFSLWFAMGTGSMKVRIPLTVTLSLLASFAFIAGLRLEMTLDKWQALLLTATSVGGFLFASSIILAIRFIGGFKLIREGDRTGELAIVRESQISIRYLLTITAVVAIIATGFRIVFPLTGMAGPSAGLPMIWAILQHTVYALIWLAFCVFCVFTPQLRSKTKYLYVIAIICLITPIHILILGMNPLVSIGLVEILNTIAFAVGFVPATFMFLLVARELGYRLHRVSRPGSPSSRIDS